MARGPSIEGGGVLGGEPVRLAGTASWKGRSGTLRVAAKVDRTPLVVDPALVVLAALDLVVLALARGRSRSLLVRPDGGAHAGVQALLLEDGLRPVGRLELQASLEQAALELRLRFAIGVATLAFEPGELVTEVERARTNAAPSAREGALSALGSSSLSTSRGRDLTLVVTTLVEPVEISNTNLAIHYEELALSRKAGTLHLDAKVQTSSLRDH